MTQQNKTSTPPSSGSVPPFLELINPHGKPAQFAGADSEVKTFFLTVNNPSNDKEGFLDGDMLAVSVYHDAEPGDLVVWWTGSERSQALARVEDDLNLRAVGGFLSPPKEGGCTASIRGVVVGRLRRAESA